MISANGRHQTDMPGRSDDVRFVRADQTYHARGEHFEPQTLSTLGSRPRTVALCAAFATVVGLNPLMHPQLPLCAGIIDQP
jgi:hypothetical protein